MGTTRGRAAAARLVRLAGALLLLTVLARLVAPTRVLHPSPPLVVGVLTAALLVAGRALAGSPRQPGRRLVHVVTPLCCALVSGTASLSTWYPPGWDAGKLSRAARAAVHGADLSPVHLSYLQTYPFNVPVLRAWQVAHLLHERAGVPIAVTAAVCAGVLTGSVCALVAALVDTPADGPARPAGTGSSGGAGSSRAAALLAQVVVLLLVGLSPWVFVVYSDQLTLLAPVAVVALAARAERALDGGGRVWWWCVAGLVAGVAASIKVTVLIPAVGVALAACALGRLDRRRVAALTGGAAVVVVALVTCPPLWQAAPPVGGRLDPAYAAPVQRWLWTGLTQQRAPDGSVWRGVYSAEVDDELAGLTRDRAAAVAGRHVEQRVRELGPGGLVRWWVAKARWNLGDGTFFAYGEGRDHEYAGQARARAPGWQRPARQVLVPGGGAYPAWAALQQALWTAVLAAAGWTCVRLRGRELDVTVLACVLSLAGTVAFTAVMEARPRYVWTMTPLVIVVAAASRGRRV